MHEYCMHEMFEVVHGNLRSAHLGHNILLHTYIMNSCCTNVHVELFIIIVHMSDITVLGVYITNVHQYS